MRRVLGTKRPSLVGEGKKFPSGLQERHYRETQRATVAKNPSLTSQKWRMIGSKHPYKMFHK